MRALAAGLLLAGVAAAHAGQPAGDGDPKETRCMYVESRTGRLGPPPLCKTNAEWAQLTRDGVKLDQFGDPMPSPDARDVASHGCTQMGGGAIDKDGRHIAGFNCH